MPTKCVLMCHAPIVIPEIAGTHQAEVSQSTEAMAACAARIVEFEPDALLVVSPHAPRHRAGFTLCPPDSGEGETIFGSFAGFGFPDVSIKVHSPEQGQEALLARAATAGVEIDREAWRKFGLSRDHGAGVPLHFLQESGWRGSTYIFGFPGVPDSKLSTKFGGFLRSLEGVIGDRVALIASGDMSHRLTPDAPAGYDPNAAGFDDWVHKSLSRGNLDEALSVDQGLRHAAAEDVIDSLYVARGFIGDGTKVPTEPWSYEGPFGVGYLVGDLS